MFVWVGVWPYAVDCKIYSYHFSPLLSLSFSLSSRNVSLSVASSCVPACECDCMSMSEYVCVYELENRSILMKGVHVYVCVYRLVCISVCMSLGKCFFQLHNISEKYRSHTHPLHTQTLTHSFIFSLKLSGCVCVVCVVRFNLTTYIYFFLSKS